ncbi:MAG: IS66 family insertion sequence element accessory protein TnpB [Candidatus Dormibacteraeota bacterium]|nr:IS66 family insertion sequence element accessory protein TnpB [Candidatus Dormibacteraeota bacterium]
MISPSRSVAVYACRAPVDMRKHYDSLAAIVTASMSRDPHSGALYLFVGKDRKRAKVLYFDGTGVCVLSKRLEKGRFAMLWSDDGTGTLTLSASELALFLEGSEVVGKLALSPPVLDRRVDLHGHAAKFASR